MFMGSPAGDRAAAIAYTLIETAKLNNLDPQAWLAVCSTASPSIPATVSTSFCRGTANPTTPFPKPPAITRARSPNAYCIGGFEVTPREGGHAHEGGSDGTRTARSYALAQAADTLHELGFKGLRAAGLRRKHVVALVRGWKRQGRSIGTMKNRTAHIRW